MNLHLFTLQKDLTNLLLNELVGSWHMRYHEGAHPRSFIWMNLCHDTWDYHEGAHGEESKKKIYNLKSITLKVDSDEEVVGEDDVA